MIAPLSPCLSPNGRSPSSAPLQPASVRGLFRLEIHRYLLEHDRYTTHLHGSALSLELARRGGSLWAGPAPGAILPIYQPDLLAYPTLCSQFAGDPASLFVLLSPYLVDLVEVG
jgi:hypothetical protein